MYKMFYLSVEKLCIVVVKLGVKCAQTAYKKQVIRIVRNCFLTYTHFLHTQTNQLMNRAFYVIESVIFRLYTLSTQPIKTIYVYKGDI